MNIEILKSELGFRTSRSSGSGGQHVNKVSTRVELLFDISGSQGLDEAEKKQIGEKLKNRISKEGILQIVNQQSRSQQRNKKESIEQFFDLIRIALRPVKPRKASRPSARQKAKRLQAKRLHSQKKNARKKVSSTKDADLFYCAAVSF